MGGKIQRKKLVKQGKRGATGLDGKVHRSKSRVAKRRVNAHVRENDYKRRNELSEKVENLEREELANWVGLGTNEVKQKRKELKLLRAKLEFKLGKKK